MLPQLRLFPPALSLLLAAVLTPASAADTETLAGQTVTVLSRSVVVSPNGSTTYIRIHPPVLPAPPPPPAPAPEAPLSPELQAALDRAEAKPYSTLALTATVYTRANGSAAVTLLSWRDGERAFTAWSNADWRLLRQLNDIETETHRFQYFPFIDTQPLAELPPGQEPAGLALFPASPAPDAIPEYCLEGSTADATAAEPVLAALDQLHAHVHLHREQLAADLARREAEAAEQARQAAADAAKPRHEKVFFWKIR